MRLAEFASKVGTVLAVVVGLGVTAPVVASAADKQVATSSRGDRPIRQRRGPYVGASVRPRATIVSRGFVPGARFDYVAGAAVTDRLTLGVDFGVTGHMGLKKPGLGVDVVVTRYWDSFAPRRGGEPSLGAWVVRAGMGVDSKLPARAEILQRAGVGGQIGAGYAFNIGRRGELALRADYDIRMRTDGLPSHAVFFGVGMRIFVHKH